MSDNEQDLELEQETPQPETPTPIETPQPPAPAPTNGMPSMHELYAESQRQRIAHETEILRLQRELQNQQQPAPTQITDEDVNQRPAEALRTMIRQELASVVGPVNEITAKSRVAEQLNSAEDVVFQNMPQIGQYRQFLSGEVRKALRNATDVNPNTYAVTLQAIVGQYALQNFFTPQSTPTQTPQTPTPVTPQNAPAPVPRGGPPAPTTPQKLSELERRGMRNVNLDPNKKEDIDAFFRMVNNDEGITV